MKLSSPQLRELESIERWGEPTDPLNWGETTLWWRNRERVIDALKKRGLVEDGDGHMIVTAAGQGALRQAGVR